jgi:hypothetical protein
VVVVGSAYTNVGRLDTRGRRKSVSVCTSGDFSEYITPNTKHMRLRGCGTERGQLHYFLRDTLAATELRIRVQIRILTTDARNRVERNGVMGTDPTMGRSQTRVSKGESSEEIRLIIRLLNQDQ